MIKTILVLAMILPMSAFATRRCSYERGKIIEVPTEMQSYEYRTATQSKPRVYKFNFPEKYVEIRQDNRSLILHISCVIIKHKK